MNLSFSRAQSCRSIEQFVKRTRNGCAVEGSGEFQVYRSLSRGTEDFLNTENAEDTEILYLNVEVAKHTSFTTPQWSGDG